MSMWILYLLATGAATALLSKELRRLNASYGLALSITAGGAAILVTAAWLLVVMTLVLDQNQFGHRPFKMWWLVATLLLPPMTFAWAKRRFSTTASIFPATAVFAAVTFVFINVGLGLAYSE